MPYAFCFGLGRRLRMCQAVLTGLYFVKRVLKTERFLIALRLRSPRCTNREFGVRCRAQQLTETLLFLFSFHRTPYCFACLNCYAA